MANNRLYLLHRPSNLAICIGKRMGFGWYCPPESDEIRRFYDTTALRSDPNTQDDFVLTDEIVGQWATATTDEETGFIKLDYGTYYA